MKVGLEKNKQDTVSRIVQTKDTLINHPITETDLQVFGDIKLWEHAPDILSKLGEPASRSKAVVWEADASAHENWDYRVKGLVINMVADGVNANNIRSVFSITAKSPCIFRTTKNIGIGSSYAEVKEAYNGYIDDSMTDETVITVGSVYGGLIFSFKGDKVETIFFGSAAD